MLVNALRANAAFSILTGADMLLFGGPIGAAIGLPGWLVAATGAGLLGFAGYVTYVSTQPTPRDALGIVVGDLGWVFATPFVLPFLTPVGQLAAVVVAGFVGLFATLQTLGVLRMMRNPTAGRPRSRQVHRHVFAASPSEVWPVVTDHEALADAAPGLAFVRIVSGEGDGLVRNCGNHDGLDWSERVTAFEPVRRMEVTALTELDNWPFPVDALIGTWELVPHVDGTEVIVTFEYDMQHGVLGDLLAGVAMWPDQASSWKAIFAAWERRMSAESRLAA